MTITLEQVQAEANRVVAAAGPDHRNPGVEELGCMYTNEYGEHCIAAQILVNLGISIPAYGDSDNEQPVDLVDTFDRLTESALDWLTKVQRKADNGMTWERAVALFA